MPKTHIPTQDWREAFPEGSWWTVGSGDAAFDFQITQYLDGQDGRTAAVVAVNHSDHRASRQNAMHFGVWDGDVANWTTLDVLFNDGEPKRIERSETELAKGQATA